MNAIEATTNELLCQRVTGVQGSERMRIGIANDQIGEQMDGTAHCVHRMLTVGGQCSCCLCYLPNKEHYLLDRALQVVNCRPIRLAMWAILVPVESEHRRPF